MTRLSTAHRPPSKPRSVMLGDLAIAAGIAGQSITLCYQDFPAPLLCETWRCHARSLDAEEVFHVRTQADLRKLTERVAEVRLVLVHALRLHVPTVWAIEMAESGDDGEGPRPAVLSRFVPPDLDEDPGATRCGSTELATHYAHSRAASPSVKSCRHPTVRGAEYGFQAVISGCRKPKACSSVGRRERRPGKMVGRPRLD
jgi:hypothetical protein